MPTAEETPPLSDLMFDWLTVLQNKAEGVAAYEKYLEDARAVNASECIAMLTKLKDADLKLLGEVKHHVFGMIAKKHSENT